MRPSSFREFHVYSVEIMIKNNEQQFIVSFSNVPLIVYPTEKEMAMRFPNLTT